MAKSVQNGQAEYGVVHVMEEEMRAAQQGVFEESSGEAGQKRRKRAAVDTKDEGAAPANKSAGSKVISRANMTPKAKAVAGSSSRQAAKRKAKK